MHGDADRRQPLRALRTPCRPACHLAAGLGAQERESLVHAPVLATCLGSLFFLKRRAILLKHELKRRDGLFKCELCKGQARQWTSN